MTRQDEIDYDYLDKLSEEEKEWLNKFTEEYVNAKVDPKNLENNLHNTQKLKKECYDRNNARNRCTWTRAKASSRGKSIDELLDDDYKKDENVEDNLIDKIDGVKKTKK